MSEVVDAITGSIVLGAVLCLLSQAVGVVFLYYLVKAQTPKQVEVTRWLDDSVQSPPGSAGAGDGRIFKIPK